MICSLQLIKDLVKCLWNCGGFLGGRMLLIWSCRIDRADTVLELNLSPLSPPVSVAFLYVS